MSYAPPPCLPDPQLLRTHPSIRLPAGIKMFYGPDTYYGEEVSVLEMDGQFDKLEELIYMESHLRWVEVYFEGNTSWHGS